ncbi:MAG: HAD domain-containing protein, partial [Chlamydiota bacterium]
MINLIYHPIQAATLVMEYLNENLSCHQSLEEVAYNAELGQKVRNVFSASASSKPVLVVFLDIDGVLHHNRQDGSVQKVVAQLFADVKFHYSFHYDTAATHLFDPNAVSNFEKLIQKNEGLGIVLSSNWREGKSTVQLREIFSKYAFSKYIIDKTPDRISREEAELLNPRFEWRAAQIQSW